MPSTKALCELGKMRSLVRLERSKQTFSVKGQIALKHFRYVGCNYSTPPPLWIICKRMGVAGCQ